jgi:hypothetical protein
MFKVKLDGVVKEYCLLTMAALIYSPNSVFEITGEIDDRMKEFIFMSVLSSAVVLGAVYHNFDKANKTDEFLAVDRLITHWNWLFPGHVLSADRSDKFVLKISGKRARYIHSDWLALDKDDPPPSWPN